MSALSHPDEPDFCVICEEEYDPLFWGRLAFHMEDAQGETRLVCADDIDKFRFKNRLMTKAEAEQFKGEDLPEYREAEL